MEKEKHSLNAFAVACMGLGAIHHFMGITVSGNRAMFLMGLCCLLIRPIRFCINKWELLIEWFINK